MLLLLLVLGLHFENHQPSVPVNVGDARDAGLIPGSGRSPGEGNDNPLQYSHLENPMDKL